MERFEIGKIVGQTFRICFSNFLPFMLLTALVSLPGLALMLYLNVEAQAGVEHPFMTLLLAPMSLISLVATGAITWGVFQQLRGNTPSLAACFAIGIQRMLPVLGVSFMVGLAVMGGFILLIVPGIIVYMMLYVAVPCAVVERPGVMGALRRSRALTSGHKGQLFWLTLLLSLIGLALGLPLRLIYLSDETNLAFVSMQWAVNVFASTLGATAMALVYFNLRSIKERFDVEGIAAVFA